MDRRVGADIADHPGMTAAIGLLAFLFGLPFVEWLSELPDRRRKRIESDYRDVVRMISEDTT